MFILKWNENQIGDLRPKFKDEDDRQQLMLRFISSDLKDLEWSAHVSRTAKYKTDVVKPAYVRIYMRRTSKSLANIKNSSYSDMEIIVGFSPAENLKVPSNLSEIKEEEYPVSFKGKGTLTQEDLMLIPLAIKEATSILKQLNIKRKVDPNKKERPRFPSAFVRTIERDDLGGLTKVIISLYNVYGKRYKMEIYDKQELLNIELEAAKKWPDYYRYRTPDERVRSRLEELAGIPNYRSYTPYGKAVKSGKEIYDDYKGDHPEHYSDIDKA